MASFAGIKEAVYARLEAEGRFEDFKQYRTALVVSGIPERQGTCAPLVALYCFRPLDGSRPELLDFDCYGEIAANHKKGKYLPPPASSLERPDLDYIPPPIPKAESWDALEKMIDPNRKAPPILEIAQWLYENAGKKPNQLIPDEVPGLGALNHLKHIQTGTNYSKFLETFVAKLIPDKKSLEYEARFSDDNRRQFDLIDEFERSIAGGVSEEDAEDE